MTWKNRVKILYCSLLWFAITYPLSWRIVEAKQFPIGIVFDIGDAEIVNAFTFALTQLPRSSQEAETEFELIPKQEFIARVGDWCQTSHVIERQICKNGVIALIAGIMNPDHLIEFLPISHRFHMPIVAPWLPNAVKRKNELDYPIKPISTHDAILDMISHYRYKRFLYLYNGQEGLHRLQTFYDGVNLEKGSVRIDFTKRFSTSEEVIEILHDIEKSTRWAFKFIVLDCPVQLAQEVLLAHVRDHGLGRRTFHYLLGGLAFDEHWDHRDLLEISSLNVTGFRIVDQDNEFVQEYSRKWAAFNAPPLSDTEFAITRKVAFIYDALLVVKECISKLSENITTMSGPVLHPSCSSNSSREIRQNVTRSIEILDGMQRGFRDVQVEGLTGHVQFSKSGTRSNYSLHVMEIKVNGSLVKVGDWKEGVGYTARGHQFVPVKPFVCTTVLETPYMMLKEVEPGEPPLKGNDRYEGFFKDFADELAERLNITYTIQVAEEYGSQNASLAGGWSGMVGQLIRNEADIGIGALTSNAAREGAIRLSKSVIFLGISIMLFKPERTWQQDIFAFMRPLSRETWTCIGLAYLGVSIVLFVIAKFNVKELQPSQKQGVTKMKPQFSISNSLWFTFASLVGQGTDLCPKSIAARLVGSVWWFLILIVTSSYTANFAAIQTVNRMEVAINSASDLAAQTSVKYGHLEGGATAEFFKKSKVSDYRKMYEFIAAHKGVNARSVDEGIARVRRERGRYAFLLESMKNKYINHNPPCNTIKVGDNLDTKGYVVGLSRTVGLSMTKINTIILEMREAGIVTDLEEKWVGNSHECGKTPKDPKDAGRLSLETLIGVFYILVIGLVLALLLQLFEFFFNVRRCFSKTLAQP